MYFFFRMEIGPPIRGGIPSSEPNSKPKINLIKRCFIALFFDNVFGKTVYYAKYQVCFENPEMICDEVRLSF